MSNRHTPGCGCCTCEFFSAPGFSNFDFDDTVDAEVIDNVLEIIELKSVTSEGIPHTSEYHEYSGDFWPETSELDFQIGTPATSTINVSLDADSLKVRWGNCPVFYRQPGGPAPDACDTLSSPYTPVVTMAAVRLRLVRARNTVPLSGAANNAAMDLYVTPLDSSGNAIHTHKTSYKRLATLGDNTITITNTSGSERLLIKAFSAGGDNGPHEQGGGGVDPEEGPIAGECREVVTAHSSCNCNCARLRAITQIRIVISGLQSSYSFTSAGGAAMVETGWDYLNGTHLITLIRNFSTFPGNRYCCGETYTEHYGSPPTQGSVWDGTLWIDPTNITITRNGVPVTLTNTKAALMTCSLIQGFSGGGVTVAGRVTMPDAGGGFQSFPGGIPQTPNIDFGSNRLRTAHTRNQTYYCDGSILDPAPFVPTDRFSLGSATFEVFLE